MSQQAKLPITVVSLAGLVLLLAAAFTGWQQQDATVFLVYAALMVVASAVKQPEGARGFSALRFLLVLAGSAVFSLGELLAACAAAAAVEVALARRDDLAGGAAHAGNLLLSAATTWMVLQLGGSNAASLALAAFSFIVLSIVLAAWTTDGRYAETFHRVLSGPFVYYLLATAAIGVMRTANWAAKPESWLVLAPVAYLVHFFHGLWPRATTESGDASPAASLPARVKAYVAVIATIAAIIVAGALQQWDSADPVRFAVFLAAALALSAWKIRLPKLDSAISPGFVLVLVSIAELSIAEVVIIAAASVIMQSYWRPARRPLPVQVMFNASAMVVASAASYSLCRILMGDLLRTSIAVFFVLAWAALYGANSFMVARILSLLENRPVGQIWRRSYFWSMPYFLVGAAAAAIITYVSRAEGWQVAMMILPLIALISLSYRMQLTPAPVMARR